MHVKQLFHRKKYHFVLVKNRALLARQIRAFAARRRDALRACARQKTRRE